MNPDWLLLNKNRLFLPSLRLNSFLSKKVRSEQRKNAELAKRLTTDCSETKSIQSLCNSHENVSSCIVIRPNALKMQYPKENNNLFGLLASVWSSGNRFCQFLYRLLDSCRVFFARTNRFFLFFDADCFFNITADYFYRLYIRKTFNFFLYLGVDWRWYSDLFLFCDLSRRSHIIRKLQQIQQ